MNTWKIAVPLVAVCLYVGCSDRGPGLTDRDRERVSALGMATMSASYDEVLTDTSGTPSEFYGYVTGLAVETPERWKFQSMHWSSPVATE